MRLEALRRRCMKAVALGVSVALAAPELALAPLWAAQAARLSGLKVSQDELRVELDRPVRYNAFATANPPRLVLELMDTRYAAAAKELVGQGKLLKRVRSGQFRAAPKSITRIVMDLAEAASYKVLQESGALRVTLAPMNTETARVPAPESPAPVEARDAAAESPTEPAKLGETPGDISTEVAVGGGKVRPVARRVTRDIMATLPREMVNLDFDNTDVRDILKLLAVRAGINIIYGADVTGSLSLHLSSVPFHEAFSTVLQMRGLVTQQVGENILRVLTPTILSRERGEAVPFTRIFALNYTKADDMKTQLDTVRSAEGRRGQTIPAAQTNSLIVIDTQEGIEEAARLIAQLDQKPKQVLIEAKLIEVQLNKALNLGIQWDYQASNPTQPGSSDRYFVGTTNNPLTTPTGGALSTVGAGASGRGTGVFLPADKIFGALTMGRVTSNNLLTATLTAAASQGKVKVLSDPKVATLNNQEATINITTQIPYVTASVASTGVTTQSVSYTTVGITLIVKPTINADGRVTLKVTPTVSQPSAIAAANAQTGAPAVDTRTANTTVLVKDGETIVIGGLIQDTVQDVVSKVPLLGDIPLIGILFRKTTKSRQRQELLVFVTPKVLTD